MGSYPRLAAATLAAGVILGCSLLQPAPAPTQSAPQMEQSAVAPTPFESPAPAAGGIEVQFNGHRIIVPEGLAAGGWAEDMPAVDGLSGAPWDASPAYVRLNLQGYVLQARFFEPTIMIYPAAEYTAMSEGAASSIQRLQAILASPAAPLTDDILPHLPYANAAQVFAAQSMVVPFRNGQGVRTLTQYAQYTAPANNHDLFYHYEGLSADGAHYVVATLPISAPLLAADADPGAPVPPGGVPFPGIETVDSAVFEAYYRQVTELLNGTAAADFTPPLTLIDALIQSLEVSA